MINALISPILLTIYLRKVVRMNELGSRTEVHIKSVEDATFYVQAFNPFGAIKILGDLQNIIAPIMGGVVGQQGEEGENAKLGISVEAICKGLHDYVDGDNLLRVIKMLINPDFISVSIEGGQPKRLTDDLVNLVFAGRTQGLFELCYEVIKINYDGFFTIFGDLFGNQGA